jgi:IPT/TIG domain
MTGEGWFGRLGCVFLGLTLAACGAGVESPQEQRPGEQARALSAPPKITTFTAKAAQGVLISVNGSGFTAAASVSFNGTPATTVQYVSSSRLRAVVPPGATSGPLSVTVPLGTALSASDFLVLPTLANVSPAHAFVGDVVNLSGSGFTAATAVKLGTLAASFVVASDFTITATVPAGFVSGKVSVTSPSGSVTSTAVVSALPLVGSFSPTQGPVGQSVSILGEGLASASAVKFGTKATTFSVVGDGELTATVPAGAATGKITVETPRGNRASAASFTVIKAPTISSFTPLASVLPVTLTVNGANFVSVTGVRVGAVALPSFTLVSSKQLTAPVPLGTPSGRVSVSNAAGTATSSATFTAVCSDVDADSVCDANDRCPGYDDRIDSDADGTPDGCDACPSAASAGLTCGNGQACNATGSCVELLCDAWAHGPGVVHGNVTIDNVDTAGDLAQLSGKWCVDGSLVVLATQLSDLTALSGLAEVSGSLALGNPILGCASYPCGGNGALTSLNGLQGLRRVGSWLVIEDAPSDPGIASLAGLSGLKQLGNLQLSSHALANLQGLEGLESFGQLNILNASALTSLSGLQNLRTATGLRLDDAPLLTDISALGAITALRDGFEAVSTGLASLHGLEGLTSAGFVQLAYNPNLTDLSALSQLRALGGLSLEGLNITSLSAFSSVTGLSDLSLYNLGVSTLAGLGGVGSLQSVLIEQNPQLLSLAELGSPQVNGRVKIDDNPSLLDCGSLAFTPAADVQITGNGALASLSCLIGTTDLLSLWLENNEPIVSFAELGALTHASRLILAQRRVESLAGLDHLQSVGSLDIFNLEIADMHGLESLTTADSLSVRSNKALRSLAGLGALSHVEYYVDFDWNWNLSQCEIANFEAQIGRPVDVNYENGPACTP